MGKLLVAGAIIVGLYMLYDSQKPGSPHRFVTGSVGMPSLKNTSGGSIGAAAVGAAGKIGN